MVKKAKTPAKAKKAPAKEVVEVVEEVEAMGFDEEARPDFMEEEQVSVPVDSGMPFPVIKLMQALSPELDDDDPKYVEDAEQGDILVTDGSDHFLLDGAEGLTFIPILARKTWVEWIPRKQGGGFVESYSTRQEMEEHRTPGNDIVVSIDYLVTTMDLDPEAEEPSVVVLQFNSPTKMAPARVLSQYAQKHSTLAGITYLLTSVKAKNKKGDRYYNFAIKPVDWTEKLIYNSLKAIVDENSGLFLPAPKPVDEF